jgi:hypothetical protein
MKLVHKPISLISQAMIGIVEFTKSMHIIFFPVPLVVAALLVIKFTFPISHAIKFLPFVATPILIFLDNILLVFLFSPRLLAELRDYSDRDDWLVGILLFNGFICCMEVICT